MAARVAREHDNPHSLNDFEAHNLISQPMFMTFEDNFSKQATTYARHRPGYPAELFEYLASIAPRHDLAWDAGTGNGQAARDLARHFRHVVATDASSEQIVNAAPHERVTYRVAPSEHSGLDPASVDLITVATALHWFDLDAFYDEARRVLRPGGIFAAWCYFHLDMEPEVRALYDHFEHDVVGDYWSPRIELVRSEYRTIPFPFTEIASPSFRAATDWTVDDMLGFMRSWSATQRSIDERGSDPLDEIRAGLTTAWGPGRRHIEWPLTLRVGRHAG